MENRCLLAAIPTFLVTNTNDSGAGSLRQAILDANANAGPADIAFDINASNVPADNVPAPGFDPTTRTWTINLVTALPAITNQVTIDGYSEANVGVPYLYPSNTTPTEITSVPNSTAALNGNNSQPVIVVNGSATGGATGFQLNASYDILRGLIIEGFGVGVSIPGPSDIGDVVQGNFIGQYIVSQYDPNTGNLLTTNSQALVGTGNTLQGILVGSTNATIGGADKQDNNVIVGNGLQGVSILAGATGNQILGNQIGIAGPSTAGYYFDVPNGGDGVLVAGTGNVIGGLASGAGNLISANIGNGVDISGAATTQVQVEGNYIGVGPGGGYLFGNGNPGNHKDGVLIQGAYTNTIGGSSASARNVISSNGENGVEITGATATGNTVANNIIGLTSGGATIEGNAGDGIAIDTSSNVVGPGNVISANLQGIVISGPNVTGNEVLGNLIGTDSGGQSDLGNAQQGILIQNASNTLIEGTTTNPQVISGNNDGVEIIGATSTGNIVQGNMIGTNQAGTAALGNSRSGVLIEGAPGNTVGGTLATARNVISDNNWGVTIAGAAATNNLVEGNYVGTDVTGLLPLGNGIDGVLIGNQADGVTVAGSASNNEVGGVAVAAGNTIAFNLANGVEVQSGTGNSILSNVIFGNTTLGISIAGDSATSSSIGAGPNNLQSFPSLTSAVTSSTSTNIAGTLTSIANTSFLVQFFSTTAAGSSGGASAKLIGSATVTTNGAGVAQILTTVSTSLAAGTPIVATATNLTTGDTSAFSTNVAGAAVTVGFTVTNTNDSGPGSLRAAILAADASTNPATSIPDQITFAIPGSGPFVIHPLTPLPQITDQVDINGYSEYNFQAGTIPLVRQQIDTGPPLIQIDGLEINPVTYPSADGLDVTQVNSWIGGLILTGFSGSAINLLPSATVDQGAIGDVVWGNEIGVGGANSVGISISSPSNVIGGSSAPDVSLSTTPLVLGTVNIIQGNTVAGIVISGTAGNGNIIDGNEILDNSGDGIQIESSNNLIGESVGNLIAGNQQNGIHIIGATSQGVLLPAQGNVIQKNLIGVNAGTLFTAITPTSTQPNLLDGIRIDDARSNVILSNVIGDNGAAGVRIENVFAQTATANVVQSNLIDFNLDGINVSSADNTVGGTAASAGNEIVNNQRNGITISSMNLTLGNVETTAIVNAQPTGNLVQGNLIGTTGTVQNGNTLDGILIADAADNTIGGTASGAGNTISGNNIGVRILNSGATGNLLEGNLIGTDSTGKTILPNDGDGIQIDNAPGNTVGGVATGAGNVISGNNEGLHITGSGASKNLVVGNFIGTDLTATVALRNALDGVLIDQGASSNTIGGTVPGAANTIDFNINNGVDVVGITTVGNSILSNVIFGNGLLGIDLGDDGVTQNHATATAGPNDFQNFPVISSVVSSGTSTIIQGTLTGAKSTSFLIQFYSNVAATASGYGPGQTLIGSATVSTNASGSVTFTTAVPVSLTLGSLVSATATNLSRGDTSEFSLDFASQLQFVVTNTNDSGPGSLRQAIIDTNAHPNAAPSLPDEIVFDIAGTGPFTINLLTPLPAITDGLDIDGYSQPGSVTNDNTFINQETDGAVLMVQLNGALAGAGADGLTIATVGCLIDGLVITGFSGAGIALVPGATTSGSAIGNTIEGNFIGVASFDTNSSSLVVPGDNSLANGVGIAISSSNNRIGGTTPPTRNIIQGNNADGVTLSGAGGTGNVVEGNYILDNGDNGISITTSNNYIGEAIGAGPGGGGNIISGNGNNGVFIHGIPAQGNVIVNNEIGTDVGIAGLTTPIRGMRPRPNVNDGILIEDAPGNTIGGLLPNTFNVISANGLDGISIQDVSSQAAIDNIVEGNKIGFNLRGGVIAELPNRDGINISSADNTIGGTSAAAQNIIINNLRNGITISSMNLTTGNVETTAIPNAQPTGNVVEGNFIGTQGGGDRYGNALDGILIDAAAGNSIIGMTGAPQVISANNDGIAINGPASTGNVVMGNLIGTMSDGVTVMGNAIDGVTIANAPDNTIGGTSPGSGNVISGNNWGVRLTGAGATGNLVEGNDIGTDATAVVSVRNAIDGVLITLGASNNTVGGTAPGAANVIDYNIDNGVSVIGATTIGDSILSNRFFGNGLLGIDLGDDGVTLNHATATPGPNNYQNFPVLSSVASSGTNVTIGGTLSSVANTSFLVQFYSNQVEAASGYGPGNTLLGSVTVTTDANGNASFAPTIPGAIALGNFVSATATNLSTGDTSEFSQDLVYQLTTEFSAAAYTVAENAGTATITVIRSSGTTASDVNYATGGGTAIAGVNYTSTSGTLDFAVGQTSESFTIPVLHDPAITGPLTVGITLSSPTAGMLGTPSTAVLTINDVDQPGALEFASSTQTVSPGATVANVVVDRVGGVGGTVTVAYATSDGTGVAGTDYTAESGVLTFLAGATSETIAVPILNSTAGNDKTFSVALSNPTGGATLGTPVTTTITIAPQGASTLSLVVTNTNDSGPGSLRQAILDANELNTGVNDITFNIPASTVPLLNVPVQGFDPTTQTWTINLQTPLPAITSQVDIDGYTQAHAGVPFRYPNAISSAVQQISVTAQGGTFTLTTAAPLPPGTTVPILYNALPATIQNDLDTILGAGSVTVTGVTGISGATYDITFTGAYAEQAIPDLIPNYAGLTGVGAIVQEATSVVGGVVIANPVSITSTPNSTTALQGNNAQQRIIINGSGTGDGTGFVIDSSDSVIQGLIIDGFGVGVSIPGPNDVGDRVEGNFIGQYFLSEYDPTTGQALPAPNAQTFTGTGNALQGVLLGSTNATIGGLDPSENNVIAGNGQQGVEILLGAVGNQVVGNQIGIAGPSVEGLYAIAPNGSDGVLITSTSGAGGSAGQNGSSASSNIIGGATAGEGNLIAANLGNGVHIVGPGATLNQILGNYIGTAPGGAVLVGQGNPGNSKNGVLIENAPDNIIGGSTTTQQNVISANNGDGVMITGASAIGNSVVNNIIGLTASGSSLLGNSAAGVAIFSASNVIGPGNVISGNLQGVLISGATATGNEVLGNLIGTNSAGEADLGNAEEGVRIDSASDNLVTGNGTGSQVISGNNQGVVIVSVTSAASGNTIQGNFIGTDKAGTLALGNSESGVLIESAPDNMVGGTSAATRNLISANHWGVIITGAAATNNLVLGNFIGTDVTGKLSLGNEIDGVLITAGASSNSIGDTSTGAGNTIAFNVDYGVDLGTGAGSTSNGGTGNSILSNSIFSNNLLGIHIPGDTSSSTGPGPNNLQSFPVLQSVNPGSSSTTIQGVLQSTANSDFLIQFFSNPGANTEGETLIGSTTAFTNAAGSVTFVGTIPASVSPGSLITATATNLTTGDTSQFSLAVSNILQLVVTNTKDSGPGSLRAAILAADQAPNSASSSPASSVPDQIVFEIPGPGPFLISLASPLPEITDQVDINGYSQYNFIAGTTPVPRDQATPGAPLIQIDGSGISSTANPGPHDGLDVAQVNSWIGGLIITGFSGAGINLLPATGSPTDQGSIGDVVWGNEIGVGTANGIGIAISSPSNLIGGTTAPDIALSATPLSLGSVNIIQGNSTAGIMISGAAGIGNVIDGNEVLGNAGDGILVESANNLIGESVGNLIAGNQQNGIHIVGATSQGVLLSAQGNVIQKNLIGVNAGTSLTAITPTSTQPNHLDGIRIDDGRSNQVLSNVIGDNGGDGVRIENVFSTNATSNLVQSNLIDYNLDGINVSSANNTVGGISTTAGNEIVSNQRNGITISSMNLTLNNVETTAIANAQPTGNVVLGNLIGTDGTLLLGNTLDGILIADAAGNTIGGATGAPGTGGGNIISGNNIGVRILNAGATGNVVLGNLIGTASDGKTVLPNDADGVQIDNAPANTVGGTTSADANVISGNNEGVHVTGSGATGNLVEGNFIGIDSSATVAVRNAFDGVLIDQGASKNTVGGTATDAANVIAYNINNGVDVVGATTTGNSILSNQIFGNGLLGIAIPGDTATSGPPGPNDLQSYPVLSTVVANGTGVTITGTLTSAANTSFLLQFYANPAASPSGFGQGQTLLGSATEMTSANGTVSFTATLLGSVSIGNVVSATATNVVTGDTSAFSLDFLYQLTTQFSAATYSVSENAGSETITVTRNGSNTASDVNYATTNTGTAVAGVNYTPTSGTLAFAIGQTSQSFTIPILSDPTMTTNLTVGLALSSPTAGILGVPSTAVLTIDDVNLPGMLEFSSSTSIVSPGASVANIAVLRVGGVGGTVSVAYTTGGGTAVPGSDYTAVSGVLTFAPGATDETIAVPILNSTAGNNKTFNVILGNTTGGATLGTPSTLMVTIAPPGTQIPQLLVTNTNDSGPGSLRQAILDADANSAGPNDIQFAIPASTSTNLNIPVPGFDPTSQTWTIKLDSALPAITSPVDLDGYSQAHFPVPFRYPSAISSAVQSLNLLASGGTFTLTTAAPLPVGTTIPIPYNAQPVAVQADLDAILGPGSVNVTGFPGAMFITFTGMFESEAIPNLIPNGSALSGLGANVSVATTIVGGVVTGDPVQISSTPNSTDALDGNNAQQRIILDGSNTGGGTGLVLDSSNSIIRGLIIDGFGVGVSIPGPNDVGDLVQGNFIGQYFLSQFDKTTGQAVPAPNQQIFTGHGNTNQGVLLGSTNATIGGLDPSEDNVIAGNGLQGVDILPGAVGNQVLGNQIGIAGPSLGGRFAIAPNGADGVLIASSSTAGSSSATGGSASSNVIGGPSSGAGNLISGNLGNGIHIVGPEATLNDVEGNYIGTAPGGTVVFGQGYPGNTSNGVLIENAPDNNIGVSSSTVPNVISFNAGAGVMITGATATGNSVANNIIGLNAAGTSVLGNTGAGVAIFSANNVVGPGNTISANLQGVLISGAAASGNEVEGNLIGTDSTGVNDLGNAEEGVRIDSASNNMVTGNGAGSQVISGNNQGVVIVSNTATATGNTVEGNFIGADKGGKLPVGNSESGVLIQSSPGNTVGGTTAAAENLISANNWGVTITGAAAIDNLLEGNLIGTDSSGKLNLGNEVDGVLITQGAASNSVGGTATGAGNTIAFNVDYGVDLSAGAGATSGGGVGNSILSNSIFNNNVQGINIPGDSAISGGPGPNDLQSYPVVTSINSGAQATMIQGTLQSVPGTGFLIQFFSTPGMTATTNSEGETLIGSTTVGTNAAGSATFMNSFSTSVPLGSLITATATNLSTGDTSALSSEIAYELTTEFGAATYTVLESGGAATISVIRNNDAGASDVNYTTTNSGTALPGINYTPASGTLVFSAGQISQSFTIPIIDNFQVGPALTVGLVLSSPTQGSLGAPSTAVLTINPDLAGALQFGSSMQSVIPGATVANITVLRTGGAGGTVTVAYTTGGGNAVPGTDYTSVSGVLTFAPGVTRQTFAVPILNSTTGSDKTFSIVLSNPTNGANLGSPATLTVTIAPPGAQNTSGNVTTPNAVGPTITNLQVVSNGKAITAIVLSFDTALDPTRADNVANYGYAFRTPGASGLFGTYDAGLDKITSASYNPANNTVTLTPAAPLPLNRFAQIVINQNANPLTGAGVADITGALLNAGITGGPYFAEFALGSKLTYIDATGNKVSLKLTGGGVMELRLGSNSDAQQLRIVGARLGRSTLTGTVRRAAPTATGRTPLAVLLGSSGVKVHLKNFVVGARATAAVTAVTPKTSLIHKVKHMFKI
jgi:hypothetical protein